MNIKPEFEAKCKRRHDAIWPDLSAELTQAAISDCSIFLDPETLTLLATLKLVPNDTAASLPAEPILKKWWAFMSDIMETNVDNSPVSSELHEIFHLK